MENVVGSMNNIVTWVLIGFFCWLGIGACVAAVRHRYRPLLLFGGGLLLGSLPQIITVVLALRIDPLAEFLLQAAGAVLVLVFLIGFQGVKALQARNISLDQIMSFRS